jgi:iron complex outermembrane receptor protein
MTEELRRLRFREESCCASDREAVQRTLGAPRALKCCAASEVRLALDSPLEGNGFEPSVRGIKATASNHLIFGASLDHANVNFNATSELGIIDPNTLVVGGLGIFIDQPDGSFGPIHVNTTNNYYGFYTSDTFDVTPQLAVTLGGRYNLALIQLVDKIGTALSGSARFTRFNPSAGFTYKITPNVTGYFNFAQANRAPTPGEIACSDPTRPCSLDLFLTSDPPGLQQIVATTYETGLRGTFRIHTSEPAGKIDWNLGLFRTDSTGEIFSVPSTIISTGFFQNVRNTRRQGIEAGIGYRDEKWQASVNYSFIDATFSERVHVELAQ